MPAAEITAAVTSIRAAYDLTKAMIGVRDGDLLAKQARDLNTMLLDVLDRSIAAREAQSAQLDQIAELKAEIASLKVWGTEKDRYELKQLSQGAFAYALKADMQISEPPHFICANCFENQKKSILQMKQRNTATIALGKPPTYRCPGCASELSV